MLPSKKLSAFAAAKSKFEDMNKNANSPVRRKRKSLSKVKTVEVQAPFSRVEEVDLTGNKKSSAQEGTKKPTSKKTAVNALQTESNHYSPDVTGKSQKKRRVSKPSNGFAEIKENGDVVTHTDFSNRPVLNDSPQSSEVPQQRNVAKGRKSSSGRVLSSNIARRSRNSLGTEGKKPIPAKRTKYLSNQHTQKPSQKSRSVTPSEDEVDHQDSGLSGKRCFDWLIFPYHQKQFFRNRWEKSPLLIKRNNPEYYRDVFSVKALDHILREKCVMYGKNLDITSYKDGKRETLNPEGRAYPGVVWDYYQNGCSVRLLNPQTFSASVMKLCFILQEFFGSFVGANVYLTPAGSQGFAPHYDDIEAFILQLEGNKSWKIYKPRSKEEELPRFSSGNFSPDEIGEPIMEVDLEQGDLLYFPRGYIHQACTSDTHSLHITLSTYQKNTWGDFIEKALPGAIAAALEEDVAFREGLPRDYLQHVGVAHADKMSIHRTGFTDKLNLLMKKLVDYMPIDAAADQMAKGYIHDALPPVIPLVTKERSIHGAGERWEDGRVVDRVELEPDTEIKLITATILRIIMEEDEVRIYHSLHNSREYHAEGPQYFVIDEKLAVGVEELIDAYPKFTRIEDIPLENQDSKLELAALLYEKGLVSTKTRLDFIDDE